jgi:hypothetical protein
MENLDFFQCPAFNYTVRTENGTIYYADILPMDGDEMFLVHTVHFVGYFISTFPGGVLSTWVAPVR